MPRRTAAEGAGEITLIRRGPSLTDRAAGAIVPLASCAAKVVQHAAIRSKDRVRGLAARWSVDGDLVRKVMSKVGGAD